MLEFLKNLSSFEKLVGVLLLIALIMKIFGYDLFVFKEKSRRESPNKSENQCRKIFEAIFEKPFPSVRPDWLKNPETGRNLELDGYCESIKTGVGKGVAFEYDGIQHSQYNPHFHSSPKHFLDQVKRDRVKEKICKEKGILLIRIPHHISKDNMESFIKTELRKHRPYSHV